MLKLKIKKARKNMNKKGRKKRSGAAVGGGGGRHLVADEGAPAVVVAIVEAVAEDVDRPGPGTGG